MFFVYYLNYENAIINLQTGDKSVLYGAVATMVNLTNSYDKQEIIPELVELAKFSKMHIPEDHELDDPDFVTKRTKVVFTGIFSFYNSIILLFNAIVYNCFRS